MTSRSNLGRAPSAVRGTVLHLGSPDAPLLAALRDAAVPTENLDPRHGSAARALVTSFLLQGQVANRKANRKPGQQKGSARNEPEIEAETKSPPQEPRLVILGTDALSHPTLGLLEDPATRTALIGFLKGGGCLVWMPQRSPLEGEPGGTAPRPLPRWFSEAFGIEVAPALSGIVTRQSFDGSSAGTPDSGKPLPRSSGPLEAHLGLVPGEEDGPLLACPTLPVRSLGVGLVEESGQPMARLVISPIGNQRGLLVAAADGLENLVARIVQTLSTPSARDPFFDALERSRRRTIALESRSSLLSLVGLDPLSTGILNLGDPGSESRFSCRATQIKDHLIDRFPTHDAPVSDTGVVYSGALSFEIPRASVGDRDLILATVVNTTRKETGVSVALNGKWLFDHRYSNLSGAPSAGWNLEFLHIRQDEMGPHDPLVLEVRPLSSLTGSAYRFGFFKGPDPGFDYLSDLEPDSIAPPGSGVALDRNANGGLLSVPDRIHYKGIGLAPDTTVVYDLNETYRRFVTRVAVDIEAANLSRVRFRIRLDGKLAFESPPLDRNTPPVPVDLDVTGVRYLEIEAIDGGGALPGELANFCNARLARD